MQIIDLRESKFININGIKIVKDIVNHLPNGLLIGLDKISLLDTDYEKEKAIGRWRRNKRTKYIQIEIMFDTFDKFKGKLLKENITHYLEIGRILLHELYHNKKAIGNFKLSKYKIEENKADFWAIEETIKILNKIFSKEDLVNWKSKYKNKYISQVGWS